MQKDELHETGQAVWASMHEASERRGMALVRRNGQDGRVLVASTSAFIRAIIQGRTGDLPTQAEVAAIRDYLKSSGNVCAIEPYDSKEPGPKRWRIFVAEEWTAAAPVFRNPRNDAIDKRADKLTPKEAGEDRAPEPVTIRRAPTGAPAREEGKMEHTRPTDHRQVDETIGTHHPLTPYQSEMLRTLAGQGGKILNESGHAAGILSDLMGLRAETVSGTMRTLESRLLLTRKVWPEGRKTYEVALTEEGWAQVREPKVRTADRILEWLQETHPDGWEPSTPKRATLEMAEATGAKREAARSGLRTLEEEGLVNITNTEGSVQNRLVTRVELSRKGTPASPKGKAPEPPAQARVEPLDVSVTEPVAAQASTTLDLAAAVGAIIDQEVAKRLAAAEPDPEDVAELERIQGLLEEAQTQRELIWGVLDEVNEGKLSPLKALADIEAVVR